MVEMGEGAPAVDRHRPGLDGVRGLAVVAVIAYHLGHLRGGFLGVDVFFVLSGYLITGLALRSIEREGHLSLRAFWGRRWRRLMPAVLLMVAVVVAACLLVSWPRTQLRSLGLDAASTLSWWANWRLLGGTSYWASVENPFRHAWSLSIEEQFYLVWPVVLVATTWVARRLGRSVPAVVGLVAGALAVASATWQVVLSHRLPVESLSRVYVGTDTRAAAPLAGCALACALHGRALAGRWVRALGLVGAAVLGVLVVTAEVSSAVLYRNGLLVLATVASMALVVAAGAADRGDRDPVGWATTRATATYLGRRSYGLYLWSWPVQVLLRFRWPELSLAALTVATVAISWGLAEASYRLVEVPQRHRSGWAAQPRPRRTAWGGELAAASLAVAACFVLAVPLPAHERVDTAEAAADALAPPTTLAPTTTIAGVAPDRTVMVTGDSVAWTVGYYKPSPPPAGIAGIDSRALIGCGLLAAEGWSYPQGDQDGPFVQPGGGACADQAEAERIGLAARPDVVLLFPGAWEWGKARDPEGRVVPAQSDEMAEVLGERLRRRIDDANAVGAELVLVEWSCPGSEAADVRSDPDFIAWINDLLHDVADEAVADGARARVLAPTDAVCVDGDPLGEPTDAKREATGDEVHVIDDAGGAWIWETWLAPALALR